VNRHESHDPGGPRRAAAETARQGRLTVRLAAAIGLLAGVLAVMWFLRV
jgi:hypothetical protein